MIQCTCSLGMPASQKALLQEKGALEQTLGLWVLSLLAQVCSCFGQKLPGFTSLEIPDCYEFIPSEGLRKVAREVDPGGESYLWQGTVECPHDAFGPDLLLLWRQVVFEHRLHQAMHAQRLGLRVAAQE